MENILMRLNLHSIDVVTPLFFGIISVLAIFSGVFLKERAAKVVSIIICLAGIILCFKAPSWIFPNFQNNSWPITGILCLIAVTSIILFASDKRSDVSRFESYPIILLALSGSLFAVNSMNLIGTYVGIELLSICGYLLAGLNRESAKSNESTMKYFLMGAVSSCIMIYGISLMYGFSDGNMDLKQDIILDDNGLGFSIGCFLLLFGLFFKTTTFPFHFWAPDVYYGINAPALSFIAVAPKFVTFAVITKVVEMSLSAVSTGLEAFIKLSSIFAGISMLIGAFGALRQTSIKRILAYSGIAHMGFILSMFSVTFNQDSIAPCAIRGLLYFLIYIFINSGIFGVISILNRNPKYKGELSDLRGLSSSSPYTAFAFSALLFSSAGIPPLAGFFSKYTVLSFLIQEGNIYLAIVGVLSSVISSFYYLKIIKTMYFEAQDEEFAKNDTYKANFFLKALIIISLLINISFVIIANVFFWPTYH